MSRIKKGLILLSCVGIFFVVLVTLTVPSGKKTIPSEGVNQNENDKQTPVVFPHKKIRDEVKEKVFDNEKSKNEKTLGFEEVSQKLHSFPGVRVLDPSVRFLLHISTDKKVYQNGETIFVRGVFLNAFDHSPMNSTFDKLVKIPFHFALINPQDGEEVKYSVNIQNSVISFKWKVPQNQAGGMYKIRMIIPDYYSDKFFLAVANERNIEIRQFVPKRYKKSIEFVRRGYVAGDVVDAVVSFERSEGGFPDSKSVSFEAIAKVDGIVVFKKDDYKCNEWGKIDVSFTLPKEIEVGDGSLTVIVKEGIVESVSKSIPIVLKKLKVSIYPEGGYSVEGVVNGVYMEVNDFKDDPMDFTANLINDKNEIIVEGIEGIHEGRSLFYYKHEKETVYYIHIVKPVQQIVPFPEKSLSEGVSLKLNEEKRVVPYGDNVDLDVSATNTREVYVVLFKKDQIIDIQKEKISAFESNSFSLKTHEFDGVLRVTVFDDKLIPLCERLVFVERKDEILFEVVSDKEQYVPGGKVTLLIKSKSKAFGKKFEDPVTIGVTVTDDTTYKMTERRERHPNIISQVFLESEIDIKKELFESDGYFNVIEDDLNASPPKTRVDLLLGTQGWRKFIYHKYKRNRGLRMSIKRLFCLDPQSYVTYSKATAVGGGRWKGRLKKMNNVQLEMVDEMQAMAPMAAPPMDAEMDMPEEAMIMPVPDFGIKQDKKKKKEKKLVFKREKIREKQGFLGDVVEGEKMPIRHGKKLETLEYERVYAQSAKTDKLSERNNFIDTLFYSSYLNEDDKGQVKVEFFLNDAVSTFRVFVDGYTSKGIIGSSKKQLVTSIKPFFVEPKIPKEITIKDDVQIPLLLVNNLNDKLNVDLKGMILGAPSGEKTPLSFLKDEKSIVLNAKERRKVLFDLKVNEFSRSTYKIKFIAVAKIMGSEIMRDEIVQNVKMVTTGFPLSSDFAGRLEPNSKISISYTTPKSILQNTLATHTKVYSSPMSSLTEGLKSLIRRPCGCFEQTSNTLYPMIMAQEYFKTHEDEAKKAESNEMLSQSNINQYIEDGYKRLLSYECKEKGGFEWFGRSPPHEALTSLGIMEFVDLTKIYTPSSSSIEDPKVVLNRATKWILSRMKGDSFELSSKKLDSFGYAPKFITEVYIIYALSSSGVVTYSEVSSVVDKLRKYAEDKFKDDSYFIGLLAISLKNFGMEDESLKLVKRLVDFQDATTGRVMKSTTSVTKSSGKNLDVETTSIGVLNFLNFFSQFSKQAELGIKFILDNNRNGRFGSTQATVLALKAIVEFDELTKGPKKDGVVKLTVNGKLVSEKKLIAGDVDPLFMDDFSKELVAFGLGKENKIELEMVEGTAMPYSMHIAMFTEETTKVEKNAKLEFEAGVVQEKANEGEVVDIKVSVSNLQEEKSAMVVAMISIPAGLEVDFDHLKEMKRGNVYDHFELFGTSEIVFYWVGLNEKDKKEFNMRCTSIIPGKYFAKPSQAFLYYEDDIIYYSNPSSITVTSS